MRFLMFKGDGGPKLGVLRPGSNDEKVEVVDLSTKKILSSIKGLSGVVNTANISPDGRKVVTAERRGIVGVWDADTGKQIRLPRGHEDQIHDVRFLNRAGGQLAGHAAANSFKCAAAESSSNLRTRAVSCACSAAFRRPRRSSKRR